MSDRSRLEEPVEAYRTALVVYTRDGDPAMWAEIQRGLGSALVGLGDRLFGAPQLREARQAYRAALEAFPRERYPTLWAETQSGLGLALRKLGETESAPEALDASVAAYRAALAEYSLERDPALWAATVNNFGIALRLLGERRRDVALLCEALESHLKSWHVFADSAPTFAALAESNIDEDVLVLQTQFQAEAYQACSRQLEGLSRRLREQREATAAPGKEKQ